MKLFKPVLAAFAILGTIAILLAIYILILIVPTLPPLDALTDYRPKIPLRVYTADNVLIGEFGEERREFVPIAQIPEHLKAAVLATEDARFYEHDGVDYIGVVRAGVANLLRGGTRQGGSTITMQVARNFYLTREKTYTRKLAEIMLSYRIENALPKDKILELYMNQIYLGERAHGFAAAARTYFGKPISELNVAEAAMLAGLPKAPSALNPVVNFNAAKKRQKVVLLRMEDAGFISKEQVRQIAAAPVKVLSRAQRVSTHAEFAAEIVRKFMYAQYQDEAYTKGFNVVTTLTKIDQDAAYAALRRGVLDYDRRHGYRGPEAYINLPGDEEERQQAIAEILLKHPDSDDLFAAVVLAASSKQVRAVRLSGEEITITGEGLRFAATHLGARAERAIRPGAVIRVVQGARGQWSIAQMPEVAAAFVALNANDGSYRALVGGFDFNRNQFDHVTQAWRQPGSTIKPFVYSAALEKGFSPSSLIDDAPLTIPAQAGTPEWRPQNDNGNYDGPVTVRHGLKRSKNLVSIRLLQAITPGYAQEYLTRFGFDAGKHPNNLTLTLGTGSVTPLQVASAYAVFANGGYQHAPYLIAKITDARGNVLAQKPQDDREAARVLDPRNAFIMDSMLRDVTRSGTAAAASTRLGRSDIAGKTGTTNDAMDGWFAGYGGNVVAVAWMGYDQPKSLGNREFGSTLALPIWIDYMKVALRGEPPVERALPQGLVQAEGDWMYAEYVGRDSVPALATSDETPGAGNLWQRLFGNSAPVREPARAAPPRPRMPTTLDPLSSPG